MPIKLDELYHNPAIELLRLSDIELLEAKRKVQLLLRCLETIIKQQLVR